jgi:antitoxin component YwqK of YwqJK toxin-antitoxin module
MKNGIHKKWYSKSHNIEFVETYKDDILHGPWKSYYENGQIEEIGLYNNGKKDGLWKWYYYSPKNEIKREQTFKDGKLIDEVDYSKASSSSGCLVPIIMSLSSLSLLIWVLIF